MNDLEERASRLQEANAELQTRIEEEKAYRREERFLWLILTFGLLDIVLFDKDDNTTITSYSLCSSL